MSSYLLKTDLSISDDELTQFCDVLYKSTGIRLNGNKRYFTDRRIAERITASGSKNVREYLSFLRCDKSGAEMQTMINLMTVNETYFFREDYQFDCLVNSMLGEIAARKRKASDRIRIWSIPCATGEEPYSLAIKILERWPAADQYDIEIMASDIDSAVLDRARAGLYESRVVGKVSAPLLKKYFVDLGGGRFRVRDELRNSIEFSKFNVCADDQAWHFRDIDVIFCRNLLIYFDDRSRCRAIDMFFEALAPGGFICLGHSESMNRMSTRFIARNFPDALIHQKPVKTQ